MADDTPFGKLLFHVPVYNIFRVHSRNLFEFSFAVSVLFAWGMQGMLREGRYLKAAFIVMAGVISVSAALVIPLPHPALSLRNPAVYIPLILMLLYLAAIAGGLKKRALLYAVFIPLFIEAYSFGAFLNAEGRPIGELSGVCDEEGYTAIKAHDPEGPVRAASLSLHTTDLRNVPCRVGMLNSYDQLIPNDYAYLFDLEPLGFSRYWEHLIKNNTLLSIMNVRYLIIPKGSPSGITRLLEEAGTSKGVSFGAGLLDPTTFTLATQEVKGNSLPLSRDFGAGTYLISFKARALKPGGASLRMEVYSEEEKDRRFGAHPLHAYPGLIGPEFGEYYRVYENPAPRSLNVGFVAPRFEPVEIKDITITEIKGYGPPPMAVEGRLYERLFETSKTVVYLNRNALPRAYAVKELVRAKDLASIKRALDMGEINPAEQALIDGPAPESLNFAKGEVSITDYETDHVALAADFPAEGFVVLSEQYYPGWKAYIDGREATLYRVNGIMRGVVVPPGRHEVGFRYKPGFLLPSMIVSGIALLGAALMMVIGRGGPEGLP